MGLPNAGKSSLLARLTRAAPKVADYPFTTLSPVLGVLEGDERQLVVADIPGLIEGASEGAGLGHDFLAHVERTRLLVHVLDIAPELSRARRRTRCANHATIERELAAHDERLARLPRVLALSKADLVPEERAREAVAEWQRRLGADVPVIATSSATGAGLARARGRAAGAADRCPTRATAARTRRADAARTGARASEQELAEHMVFRPGRAAPAFGSSGWARAPSRSGAGASSGCSQRFDLDNEDAMAYLEGRLRRIGVLRALEAEGFQPGDEIEIAGVTFELDPRSAAGVGGGPERPARPSTLRGADETRRHQARLERRRRQRGRAAHGRARARVRSARRRAPRRAGR